MGTSSGKGDRLSPSAQNALIEIGSGAKTAQELGRRLDLDKSSISRILGKLQDAGLVRVDGRSSENYRAKLLSLTTAGNTRISAFGEIAEARRVIPTPHLEALAAHGLRYTNMHSTAL